MSIGKIKKIYTNTHTLTHNSYRKWTEKKIDWVIKWSSLLKIRSQTITHQAARQAINKAIERYHDGPTKFGLCAYKCITPTKCGTTMILCTTTATWNFLPFFHRINEQANTYRESDWETDRESASDAVETSKFVMSVWHMKLSRSSNMIDTETALLSLCRLFVCVCESLLFCSHFWRENHFKQKTVTK